MVKNLKSDQKLLLVSSKDDERVVNNDAQTEAIFEAVSQEATKEIKIYERGGHGTKILETNSEAVNLIFEYIK